jgi:L-alanine-DL-glutamate epimerase-like enolase superfamily enzyme
VKVSIDVLEARLRAPVVSAWGSVRTRPLVLLRLEDADGAVGFGEAAPLAGYDGVTVDDVRAALRDCLPALTSSDGVDRDALLAECVRVAVLPQAIAAVDLALWDLSGRRAGRPVWQLLGGSVAPPVEVGATIAVEDRAGAALAAARFRSAGFRCLKVKVGLGDDAGRLAAVRAAAGAQMAIRIDANGAWSVQEAVAGLRLLEPVGIELCEEPVSGLSDLARVCAQSSVPIALDESAALPGAFDHRVCEAVCLKIARCGGITGVLDAARRARGAGYEVYLASTYDGPLGIAAALHACTAVRPDRPCGLATLGMFERPEPLSIADGLMPVPAGAGLGEGLISWYG